MVKGLDFFSPPIQGVRMVMAEQCWHKSLSPLMKAVRNEFKDVPTYISFDIDAIDPGLCPGTGTWIVKST